MRPSVGAIVHYVSYGTPGGEYVSECRAAIVAAVHEPPVDAPWLEPVTLVVFNPAADFFGSGQGQRCLHDEAVLDSGQRGAGGTWHWPEPVGG